MAPFLQRVSIAAERYISASLTDKQTSSLVNYVDNDGIGKRTNELQLKSGYSSPQ